MKQEKTLTIPLDRRVYLSLEEAMSYTGLDEKTLRKLSDGIYNSFVLWTGRRRLLKREMLEEYAKQCGTKVSINDEKTIGILLDVLLPEVNLAFTFPSRETDRGAKVIEVMQYMCAARKIQLIEVRKKEPIELAHEIKQAFAKAHLYIDSDSEKEIDYLRKWYFHQTV